LENVLLNNAVLYCYIENVSIPYIFMDKRSLISSLEQVVTLTGDKHLIKGSELPYFSVRNMLQSDTAYFAELALPYLKAFVESGIQARWLWVEDIRFSFQRLVSVVDFWGIRDNEKTDRGGKLEKGF